MTALNGHHRLSAHDVSNGYGFCRKVLSDSLRRSGGTLRPSEYESAVQSLAFVFWRCSLDFDPTRNSSFSKYAYGILSRRVVDWYRETIHDTRYGERPDIVSFDEVSSEASYLGHRLVDAHRTSVLDPDACLDPALERLYKGGDIGTAAYLPPASCGFGEGTPARSDANGASGKAKDERKAA